MRFKTHDGATEHCNAEHLDGDVPRQELAVLSRADFGTLSCCATLCCSTALWIKSPLASEALPN
eukprot:568958-Pyramimonas_sp.AAC.1